MRQVRQVAHGPRSIHSIFLPRLWRHVLRGVRGRRLGLRDEALLPPMRCPSGIEEQVKEMVAVLEVMAIALRAMLATNDQ